MSSMFVQRTSSKLQCVMLPKHQFPDLRVQFQQHNDITAYRIRSGNSLAACSFFFSSRRRHTRFDCDWSSDVCSSDLYWLNASELILPLATDSRQLRRARAQTAKSSVAKMLLPLMGSQRGSPGRVRPFVDRKSTRLNSSHSQISYAVFCLKKKTRP